MIKINILTHTAIALCLLFSACSNENIENEVPSKLPAIIATMDSNTETKSAIIEGNPDYTKGENFYWLNGDKINVNFIEASFPNNSYIYTATVAGGTKSNIASFTAPILPLAPASGTYSVFAFSPGGIFTLDALGIANCTMPGTQTQVNNTTDHIGVYDYMYATQKNVSVDNSGNSTLNLKFTHQCAMLRFTITNSSTTKDLYIEKINISKTGSSSSQFYSSAAIDYNSGNPTFTPSTLLPHTSMDLNISNGNINPLLDYGYKIMKNGSYYDAYMMVMPTPGYTAVNDNFVITLTLANRSTFPATKYHPKLTIPCSSLDFLNKGFKPSMRYYFKISVTDAKLTSGIL